ncbi:MAG: pyrroloquinoline quinone-dependent dehydrogenase [Acidobacteria bacterium]|nr:MAG: pyrroloquinoline quinone-dependent dehydrogenase [Acidobacteriota bacterium]
MSERPALLLLLATFTGSWISPSSAAQSSPAPREHEWRSYGADLASTRYAPLEQITASNFEELEIAWRLKTDFLGPRPEYMFQSTPLMVGGVVYSTAGTRRAVVALDARTGEMIWMHREEEGARGEAAPRRYSGRGLSYWSDGTEGRILYVTPGYQLVSLDVKTGRRTPEFGIDGLVDLKRDFDQEVDPLSGAVGLHASPLVAGNVVIVGAAHETGANPRSRKNVKGYVRAYDVRTGRRRWIFHTIPRPGEIGYDTWENGSAEYTGNTGVWAQMSADESLGLAYLPVELPTGDYYGGDRPGKNLFSESIVAVDLESGERRWHFQLVHHGIWDMDIPCAPILADIVVDGRAIKALAQPTKQGFLYVLDRETGEPVWPIEERPVPRGDVPGEWYSPTQPHPTRPPAYERQGLAIDDLIDFTSELRAEAEALVSKYRIGPIFTPPVLSNAEGPIATLALAAQRAATNWQGGSYDPETHVLYVSSQRELSMLGLMSPPKEVTEFRYHQGTVLTGVRRSGGAGSEGSGVGTRANLDVRGLPLVKPPYGQITAIDLDRGEILWQVAHGDTPDFIRRHPALEGVTIPRTGRRGSVGTLVTKTLLIAGEGSFGPTPSGVRGAMLRAYDKSTGQEVGAVYLPAPQTGSPMTYMVEGQQYLVVAVSGVGYSGELLAFRLPREMTLAQPGSIG